MLDARGYSCPMPVILVQKEIKNSSPDVLTVMVDNQCAVENVTRFARHAGYDVRTACAGEDFRLELTKSEK